MTDFSELYYEPDHMREMLQERDRLDAKIRGATVKTDGYWKDVDRYEGIEQSLAMQSIEMARVIVALLDAHPADTRAPQNGGGE